MSSISCVKSLYLSYFLCIIIFPVALARRQPNDYSRNRKPIVMTLTHHHSTNSPFYDPTQTIKDRADFDLASSHFRASSYLPNATLLQPDAISTGMVTWRNSGFLANLKVGSRNVTQYVVTDTGSSFLWINCECGHDCNLNVPFPLYNPKESSTYMPDDCVATDACFAPGVVNLRCPNDPDEDEDACTYELRYADDTKSKGKLSRDDFRFAGSMDTPLWSVVFGCSEATNLYANGILGLGNNAFSILQQKDYKKFAYCIGNISERSYAYHKLIITDKFGITPIKQTPLVVENRYYINLVNITIGDVRVEFDPAIMKRNGYKFTGGMAIDSGSTYTYLLKDVHAKFEGAMRDIITGDNYFSLERNDSLPYGVGQPRLCYNGNLVRDLDFFPLTKFQFEGGAILELVAQNLFQQVTDDSFCLGVLPADYVVDGLTFSIMGNLMMQYSYIAFDLDKNMFGFQDMACSTVTS